MVRTKFTTNTIYGSALAIIFGLALLLRTYFPHDTVFLKNWIKFKWYDSWYHMRLVENLVHHFPSRIQFDPYTAFPHGQAVFFAPLPDLLLGFFIWLFSAGSPSKEMIETLGAYFPAILGALVIIPVFFIGKELFNKKVGLLAAALVMIFPGQFLLRSLLGFTDHHVAETLFISAVMLFFILALKSKNETQVSYDKLKHKDWVTLKKPLIYSLLAGISLGLYLLSWSAGAFFIFIILLAILLQHVSDHMRSRSTDYLCIIGIPSFLIALLIVLPFIGDFGMGEMQITALLIGLLGLPILSVISMLMIKKNISRIYYPLVITILVGTALAILHLISPSLFDSIVGEFYRFKLTGGMLTIGEVQPLTLPHAWEEFTTSFYLSLISLVAVAYLVIKEGAPDKMLLLTWSLLIFLAMFGQNRFAYYYAVNAALLTAYLSWITVGFVKAKVIPESIREGWTRGKETLAVEKKESKKSKKSKRRKVETKRTRKGTLIAGHPISKYVFSIITILILFFLVFYPNIGMAINTANKAHQPDEGWHEVLTWMRENTPEPFEDADFFYEIYEKPAEGEAYSYPDSAYGVMAWWDYGHWITYIAHRIPNSNPHQVAVREAAQYFTAQDEESANKLLDDMGSRYVVIDFLTALHDLSPVTSSRGKFGPIAIWAGMKVSDFFGIYYYRSQSGVVEPVVLYHPKYYQSMSTRLYVFEGKQVTPDNSTIVISYINRTNDRGNSYKEITSYQKFATYYEAVSFIESHGKNYVVVGMDQFTSPIPLEKLEHYSLVHASPTTLTIASRDKTSTVKIFEYTP
ncbi:MAG TPA: oligosaccharyl transferase, archaeosortase A system-associated [Dehalococcoidia bacterium]|nr:oligosaccharyl transferase, archaeosortase A system-associated [Dehalococcoidia bacterium]